jgi:hypothetical protein
MAKTQQRFEFYGGPICGDVVEKEEVSGIHTIFVQSDYSPTIHYYKLKPCLPMTLGGKRRKSKGYYYQGIAEIDESELQDFQRID